MVERTTVLALVAACLTATTLVAALQASNYIGSSRAQGKQPKLHPAVLAHIDNLHKAAGDLHVNVTRLFGQYDPKYEPVTVIRRAHRRNELLPAFSQPSTLPNASAHGNAPANWSVGLPDGFDWRSYVQYHPEWATELDCEWKAAQHYKEHGAAMSKWYTRLRVILRYTVLGGLMNQQMGHISAFMLAAATGAELTIAPAFTRGSFAIDEFSTQWAPMPIDQLLDMPHVSSYWKRRGLVVHPSPAMVPAPNRRGGPDAVYTASGLQPELKTGLPVGGYDHRDLDEVAEVLRFTAVAHAERVRAQNASMEIPYVIVDMTGWCWAVRFTSSPQLAWDVFNSLRFAPHLVAAAASMEANISRRFSAFNGVHLRIEADMAAAHHLHEPLGDTEFILSSYLDAMQKQNFSSTVPVYVASGLFGYNDSSVAHILGRMNDRGVCSAMLHRKMLLPASIEAGLTEIQRSAVDMLALTSCRRFVGFAASSLSSFVMFFRTQNGFSAETNSFVGRSYMMGVVTLLGDIIAT